MFDKLKQLNQLRNLQNAIKKETAESSKNGVKIVINGAFDLVELSLNKDLDVSTQERLLKECFAEAKNKVQAAIAKNYASSLMQ